MVRVRELSSRLAAGGVDVGIPTRLTGSHHPWPAGGYPLAVWGHPPPIGALLAIR